MKSKWLVSLGLFGLLLVACSGGGGGGSTSHEHTYSDKWSYDETYHWHAATCEHTEETKDKAQHQFGSWVVDKDPTGYEEGSKHRNCDVCNYKQTEKINESDHAHKADIPVEENRKEPSCTVDGSYDLVTYCKECHEEMNRVTKTLPSLGHNYGDWEVTTPAKCVEDGVETRVCKRDATHKETRPIPATGHQHTATREENRKGPTCTVDGSYDLVTYCTDDNAVLSREPKTIPATGHVFGDWVTDKEATELEDGLRHRECVNCGQKEEEAIDAIGSVDKLVFTYISRYGGYEVEASPSLLSLSGKDEEIVDVAIPKKYEDKPVIIIKENAFKNCPGLKSIVIPDSIVSIGIYAFSQCKNLTSITIPNSVTSIGYSAFEYCSSLESVALSNNLSFINHRMFDGCKSLKSLEIPNGVTTIDYGAFASCESLLSITIPDSVTTIGEGAFSTCKALKSLEIPSSVTSIGGQAFSGCLALTSVTIPGTVTSLGGSAFQSCSSLESVIIQEGITSISSDCFNYCRSLTSVTIPNTVTSIGGGAFSYCTSLASIEIPNSVTSFGNNVFQQCTSFTPTKYDNASYVGNTNNPYLVLIEADEYASTIEINENCKVIASASFNWCNLTSLVIPEGVVSIGNSAFEYCSSLVSVTIPNTVTSIGYYAFCGCSELTTISIPESVTSLERDAFQGCDKLEFNKFNDDDTLLYLGTSTNPYVALVKADESIETCEIHENCKVMIDEVFNRHSSLVSVTIPSGVISISRSAFTYCNSLTSVSIPDTVTYIGDFAFQNCRKLSNVTIPDGVTYLGDSAFSYCTNLRSITIPSHIKHLGATVFAALYDAKKNFYGSLNDWLSIKIEGEQENIHLYLDGSEVETTSIAIPEGTTTINEYAFSGCYSLASITLPETVTSIGKYAFSGCEALSSINIPTGITEIKEGTFAYTNLKKVSIPSGVTSVGEKAFENCRKLVSVSIPKSVKFIGYKAFAQCTCDNGSIDGVLNYEGTIKEWNSIAKTLEWNYVCLLLLVHCSDGDITLAYIPI